MARLTEIVFPDHLRKDGIDLAAIHEAIVKAVAKRVAGRRAAADQS